MKRLELVAFLVFLVLAGNLFSQSVRYKDEIFSAYTLTSNITYGTGSKNVLDIYTGTGDTETKRPLIVFVHGGAFKSGDKDPNSGSGGAGFLRYFGYGMAKRGYVVASINYRLAGWSDDATHYKAMLEALQDTKAAIRFFRKNGDLYGVDTSMIYVCGESAGAHTAVQMAYLDSTKVLGFSQWGSIGWSAIGGSFENLSLGNGGYSSQVKGCFSNWGALVDTNYMQAGGIPVFCVHGTADATVPYMYGTTDSPFDYGSQLIYNRAQNLGIPSGLALYPGYGHSLDSNPTALADAYVKSANWAWTTLMGGTSSPSLSTSTISLSGMTYYFGYGPSSVLTYTLSASNLSPASDNVTVTAAADYEISNTNATTGFTSTTLSVPYTSGGTFANPTIWVRLKAGLPVGTYSTSEIITNVAGTASANVSCSGSVAAAVPTVTATPASLTSMTYIVGNGPSTSVPSYTLSGAFLSPASGNITVTAATDYEISNTSASAGFFDSSTPVNVAYSNSGGTIANPTIWVRLKAGLSVGTYNTSEIVTNVAGTGSANVTCSGSVSVAVAGGDYRTNKAAATWSNLADWDYYNGTSWSTPPASLPTAGSNVFVQSGHTVSITAAGATCKDLNMCNNATSGTTGTVRGVVDCTTFNLDVNGSLRSYWGAAATGTTALPTPTYFGTVSNTAFKSTTGAIRFVGNTRNITTVGEWGSTVNSPSSTNGNVEFALSPGQIGTLSTNCKFANVTFTSGTYNILTIGCDRAATLCNVTIAVGCTVITTSTSNSTFQRSSSNLGGALTVNGTLNFANAAPKLSMTSCTFNGTIIYSYNGAQLLVTPANSGGPTYTYNNLILSGPGVKTLGGNTTVSGTLSMQGTAAFALGGFTLTYGGSSTLEYAGTSAQSTGTEFQAALNNLTINNAAGVSMGSACTLNGVLSLTNGLLTTSGTYPLTLGAAATVSGGSVASFVNGPISLTAAAGKTLMAPIGKGSSYRPLWSHIYTLPGSGMLTAEQIEVSPSGTVTAAGNPVLSVLRYFHVTQTGLSGGSIDLTLSWGADDEIADSTITTVVGGTNGGTWTWADNTGAEIGYANTVTTASFDPAVYPLGDCALGTYSTPLPISLTSFTAVSSNGSVKLNWKTSVETDNHGFDIERSSDKLTWSKLGFVQAAGNSNTAKSYSFSDNNISVNGKYYYRLKQINLNGKTEYFGAVECNVIVADRCYLYQNYPNPFNPSTVIKYEVPETGVVTLKVFNAIGKEVATLVNEVKQGGIYDVTFNAGNLASGIYFYRLQAGSFISIKKITLLK